MAADDRRRRCHRAPVRSRRRRALASTATADASILGPMTNIRTHSVTSDRLSAEPGTILSIWAHPDDETYLAAGIMATAVDNGDRVVCVSATAGEHGTADPIVWPPARLGQVRRWEANAAMAVLGVTEHRFLGYEDGTLAGRRSRGHRPHRGPDRRDPSRHDPHLRRRRDDVPPRSHRDPPLGHRRVAPTRVSRPAALRDDHRRVPAPLPRSVRGVEHVHDRRAADRRAGRPARTPRPTLRGATWTANSRRCAQWRPRPPA